MLSLIDEPFVPDADLDEVDRRWQALCARNPAYFDGRIVQVLGVHRNGYGGASIHVADCAYRFWAVQTDDFDLAVRPLGVKGITVRDGRVLLGLRSAYVAGYPGLWEFAPGGGVEPGCEPADIVQKELSEETGLRCANEPVAVAIIFDAAIRCWELVFRLTAASGTEGPTTPEYQSLEWRKPTDLPHNLSPIARQMVPLMREAIA